MTHRCAVHTQICYADVPRSCARDLASCIACQHPCRPPVAPGMFIISGRRAVVPRLSCGHFAIVGHAFHARPWTCGLRHGASARGAIAGREDLECWAQTSSARHLEPSLGRATGLRALLQYLCWVPVIGIPDICYRQTLCLGSVIKAAGRGAHRRLGPRHKRLIAVVRRPPVFERLLFAASGRLHTRTAPVPRSNSDTDCKSVHVLNPRSQQSLAHTCSGLKPVGQAAASASRSAKSWSTAVRAARALASSASIAAKSCVGQARRAAVRMHDEVALENRNARFHRRCSPMHRPCRPPWLPMDTGMQVRKHPIRPLRGPRYR